MSVNNNNKRLNTANTSDENDGVENQPRQKMMRVSSGGVGGAKVNRVPLSPKNAIMNNIVTDSKYVIHPRFNYIKDFVSDISNNNNNNDNNTTGSIMCPSCPEEAKGEEEDEDEDEFYASLKTEGNNILNRLEKKDGRDESSPFGKQKFGRYYGRLDFNARAPEPRKQRPAPRALTVKLRPRQKEHRAYREDHQFKFECCNCFILLDNDDDLKKHKRSDCARFY